MLGILCGLEAEAKIARQVKGALVACAAARPGKARELAQGLRAHGATRLMSFGIAGALESSVQLGDLFIGTEVISKTGRWSCDKDWGQSLASRLPQAKCGKVFGSEVLVARAEDKAALYRQTHSMIVDMESQCAAEVAAEAHLPLMVIRAVCDDASMNVPPLVMAAIAEDGSVDVRRGLSHLARHPSHIFDLVHMLRGTGKALHTLKSARDLLG